MQAVRVLKLVSIAMVTVALASGCATTRVSDSDLSPEQRQMREQARAYNKTVGQGIGIGALAGGLLMAALGGDAQDIARGAAVGAAVGGIAGSYYADKQKRYASNEQMLNSMIADARNYNRESRQLIATAERVYAAESRRLATLRRQLDAGEINRRELDQQLRIARSDQELLQESLVSTRKEKDKYEKAMASYVASHPGQDVSVFAAEITEIGNRVNELEALSQQLTNAINIAAS